MTEPDPLSSRTAPALARPRGAGTLPLPEVKLISQGSPPSGMAKAATISSKGQITLPKELRDKYHLVEGETALLLDTGEGILVKHGRASLRGLLKGKLDSQGFEADLRKLRKEWSL